MDLGRLFGAGDIYRRGLSDGSNLPEIGKLDVVIDIAEIKDVDYARKTLSCRTLVTKMNPTNVEWASLLFDPVTGNGVYVTPKPGMQGIFLSINKKTFFLMTCAVIDKNKGQGYTDDREEVPPGSLVVRPSKETKILATPNLLIMQGANFCKILLQRVSKSISMLFYKLRADTLGGYFSWESKTDTKTTEVRLSVSSDLPGQKDVPPKGSTMDVRVGDGPQLATLTVTPAVPRQRTTEDTALTQLRAALISLFNKRGIQIREQLELDVNKDVAEAFLEFTQASDLSQALMVESIIVSASYTDPAQPEGVGGIRRLSPTKDQIEELATGKIVPTLPVNLDAELEFLIPANIVENKKQADGSPTIAKAMIEAARVVAGDTFKEGGTKPTTFDVGITPDGALQIKQKGDVDWSVFTQLALSLINGPINIDSGKGIRVLSSGGQLYVGNGVAGFGLTPDGVFEVRCTGARIITYRPSAQQNSTDKARLAELQGKPSDSLSVVEAAELKGLLADAASGKDGIVTDNGSLLFMTPDLFVAQTGEEIRFTAPTITESNGVKPKPEYTTVPEVRARLETLTAVPALVNKGMP